VTPAQDPPGIQDGRVLALRTPSEQCLLDRLAGPGAEALIEHSDRYGLRRVDDLLIAWLQAGGDPPVRALSRRSASGGV
jgi:hypothetical protein